MKRARAGAIGLVIAACLVGATPAGAASITEFPIGSLQPGQTNPTFIATSPTGRLWFTDNGQSASVRQMNALGQLVGSGINAPAGAPGPTGDLAFNAAGDLTWLTNEPGPSPRQYVVTRSAGGAVTPDGPGEGIRNGYAIAYVGTVAFATFKWIESNGYTICKGVEPDGVGNCFGEELVDSAMTDVVADSAGRIWVMQPEGDVVRRVNAAETGFDLAVPMPAGSRPTRAALGRDGNLWIAAFGNSSTASNTANRIIRLTPAGEATSFPLPAGTGPKDIAAGPDGALWFTEMLSNRIGRISICGGYTSQAIPTANSQPWGIAAGLDGGLWFTESNGAKIGRLAPDPAPASECTPVAGPPPGGGGGGGGGGGDLTKPALSSLTLSRTAFRVSRTGGTRITFSLSEASQVRFTVQRPASGRSVNGKCVQPKRSNRGKRRCTRWLGVSGSFTVGGAPGQNTVTFRGRLGGRALPPGPYRLNGQATDGAANRSAVVRKSFRILN